MTTEKISLFPYQLEGSRWIHFKRVALLADEMGLGKSAQAIHAADLINARRILVICPAIARFNWEREFRKFSTRPRSFAVILKREKTWPESSIIASYEGAMEVLHPGEFDLLILDEAHFLKSKDAKRTKAIFGKKGLCRRAKYVWALSGTPAPNHPGELWPLLFTFGVTQLKYTDFLEHFCHTFKGTYGLQILGAKKDRIPELKKLMKTIMLRRKKEDVMKELPPITYSDHVVEPGPVDIEVESSFVQYCYPPDNGKRLAEKLETERGILRSIVEHAGFGRDAMKAFEALANSVSTLRRYTGIQKVQPVANLLKEELEANAYKKIVVFAIHRDVIEGIRFHLKEFNAVTLYGGHTPEKQQKHVDKFQTNPYCRVMIANIQCAGTAITLTAANQVVFIEQDWVPGNNAQAVMRCHRIGQEQPVFVRFFSTTDSIDERITQILKRKTKDLTAIFDT